MFKDLPNRTTPLNASYLNNVLNLILPINKVEVFFDAEDHSNYMGFTWERISQGRVPVGLDVDDANFNTIGKTGGEKSHKLTINEMPSHDHGIRLWWGERSGSNILETWTGSGHILLDGNPNETKGGNGSHNNLQPYIVMAFWKRVA